MQTSSLYLSIQSVNSNSHHTETSRSPIAKVSRPAAGLFRAITPKVSHCS